MGRLLDFDITELDISNANDFVSFTIYEIHLQCVLFTYPLLI